MLYKNAKCIVKQHLWCNTIVSSTFIMTNMIKKINLFTLWNTFLLLGLFGCVQLTSCKKDKEDPPKYFTVCFWTDKDGYPIEINLIKDYGQHFDDIPFGVLSTYTNGPVTDCSSANTLTKIIEMDTHLNTLWGTAPIYGGYHAYLKPPFYCGNESWFLLYGTKFTENTCNIIKLERDTTLRKVTFWTNNSTYFQNNNYLKVKINNTDAGKICKSFSSDPGCGLDSTLNAIFYVNQTFAYSIYKNNDSLIFSGNYLVTNESCVTIQIP